MEADITECFVKRPCWCCPAGKDAFFVFLSITRPRTGHPTPPVPAPTLLETPQHASWQVDLPRIPASPESRRMHANFTADVCAQARPVYNCDMHSDCVVYVVDDDASVRKSISWLLDSANYPTECFASAQEFLDSYKDSDGSDGSNREQRAACLLLDVRMPGASGLQLQSMLDNEQISIPIIFVSGHVDVRTASEAFRAGACDVLAKPVEVDVLLSRVEEALEENRRHRETQRQLQSKRQQLEKLTPKEIEVFEQLLKGRTIKQLAGHFGITFQTAAKHRARVLEKLDVETDAQLIFAFQEIADV